VRFNHVASFVVNANYGAATAMRSGEALGLLWIIAAMAALLQLKWLLMVRTTLQVLATLMNPNVIHLFELWVE